MKNYEIYIYPPLFAASGFLLRFIWDFYINRHKRVIKEKKNLLEFKLNEFYYPIFFNLKREQIIWEKIIKLYQQSPCIFSTDPVEIIEPIPLGHEKIINCQIIRALDEENLKIHKNVQSLIHSKISMALPPADLILLLLQYDEHVIVYDLLRKLKLFNKFPIEFNSPYPINLFFEIDKYINELNIKYIKYNKQLD